MQVVNPERDVFEFKKNEMGFVSPGKQATVQVYGSLMCAPVHLPYSYPSEVVNTA